MLANAPIFLMTRSEPEGTASPPLSSVTDFLPQVINVGGKCILSMVVRATVRFRVRVRVGLVPATYYIFYLRVTTARHSRVGGGRSACDRRIACVQSMIWGPGPACCATATHELWSCPGQTNPPPPITPITLGPNERFSDFGSICTPTLTPFLIFTKMYHPSHCFFPIFFNFLGLAKYQSGWTIIRGWVEF